MKYYVSQDKVDSAIEYFQDAGFDSDDMLFLFIMSKHFGISASFPVTYLVGQLSDEKKKDYLNTIWMLAGVFDSTEICGKRGLIFPTAFNKLAFYQPGTDFSGVLGRIKDTIEKKNINVPIYNDNGSKLTLKSNYRDLIQENYLKGNKISLSHLAAWLFRFTSFDFDSAPDEKQFTRVVEKAVRKFLKITKNDYLWLFENDLFSNRLTATTACITGIQVRSKFAFEAGKMPEIQSPTGTPIFQLNEIERDTIERYLALNGDNPSDSDILDILRNKKQIVLTGVPGVGKSRYTKMLCNHPFFAHSKTIQFHASYSYEDFIGAETLKTEDAVTYVSTRKGMFLEFSLDAQANPNENYLFVIDELNRGNIAEIFGETILALDRNYEVALSREYEGASTLKLPENLYIVASMNTSDRNIAFLDLAIRRRFAFVPLVPNYDFLSEDVTLEDFDLGNILRVINRRIVDTLKDPELILGQSYFIPQETTAGYVWDFEKFKNQFNFVILPTLREYSFNEPSAVNSIIGDNLGDGIQEADEFKLVFSVEFSA
jgi:5-methylcytosine-specific restriction protein B